jgi:hypothetical protein
MKLNRKKVWHRLSLFGKNLGEMDAAKTLELIEV